MDYSRVAGEFRPLPLPLPVRIRTIGPGDWDDFLEDLDVGLSVEDKFDRDERVGFLCDKFDEI